MNSYLIPANSKKSQLILGYFTGLDLGLFLTGCGLSLLLLMLIRDASAGEMIIILLPALITGLLVMPVPHYHNVLQFILNVVNYIVNPKRYYWRGWCVRYEREKKRKTN